MSALISSKNRKLRVAAIGLPFLALVTGCLGGGDGDGEEGNPVAPGAGNPGAGGPGPSNSAPEIAADPPEFLVAGDSYSFSPTASDADGDTLTFSATNLPSWAELDTRTGEVTASPDAGDIGIYSAISIAVSDGASSASVGPFDIEIIAPGAGVGTATLAWNSPSEYSDGTPLNDLAGFNVYWRRSAGPYENSASIDNPGLTTYVVNGLAPGNYEFAVTARNSSGVESEFSNVATLTVSP